MNIDRIAELLKQAHAELRVAKYMIDGREMKIEFILPEQWEERHEEYAMGVSHYWGGDELDFDDVDISLPVYWGTRYEKILHYEHAVQTVSNDPLRLVHVLANQAHPEWICVPGSAVPRVTAKEKPWCVIREDRNISLLAAYPHLSPIAGLQKFMHDRDYEYMDHEPTGTDHLVVDLIKEDGEELRVYVQYEYDFAG
ncbi:hypothetical protein [Paenibacillus shenyangensis]|uniref:hypothetical protein n=1 Tax=Paenibacillus sp. A9 TaxID=1284352 RepID=UPI000360240E|nr:hypothetical protein [Paenibacillus sp. A9]